MNSVESPRICEYSIDGSASLDDTRCTNVTTTSSEPGSSSFTVSESFIDLDDTCNTSNTADTSGILEATENSLNISNTVDSYKTIQTFFDETDRISKTLTIDECDIGTSNLTSILRPYQRETVQWMVMRESEQKKIQRRSNQIDNIV